jgi:hypothetical protein
MEFFHLNADSPLWLLFLRELVYITNILRELIYFHPRSLPFRERVNVIVDEITGVIHPQWLHLLLLHCKIIIIEVHLFIIHTFGFHFIHTIGILAIIFGIIFGTIMLITLFSRAAMAVAKKIGIFKSNGPGKNNITDDYEIVDEPTSCEVFPYRNHQPNSFDSSTDDEIVKDDNHVNTTDDRSVTTKDSPSVPLSTRDPSEIIKARFDRDFFPKYGSLWRKIQEKKSSDDENDRVDTTDDHNSSASTKGDLERSRMIEMSRLGQVKQPVTIAFETYEKRVAEPGGECMMSNVGEDLSVTEEDNVGEDLSVTDIVVDTSDEEDTVSVVSASSRFSDVVRALDYGHLWRSPLFSDLRNDEILDEILDEINNG